MIKNIIFDLGNVLLKWEPDHFLLRYTSDIEYIKGFISKVIHTKLWLELDQGTLSLENAKEIFISIHPRDKDFLILFFNNWMDMLIPIEKNVKIVDELKVNDYKLYVISNFIKEAYEYVTKKYSFFSQFDGQIISGFEQIIKPNKQIYTILLNRYKLNPKDCIFIDDVSGFLRPAKKLGMQTIWYRPHTDLKKELKKLHINI